jgi:hypothetical protein
MTWPASLVRLVLLSTWTATLKIGAAGLSAKFMPKLHEVTSQNNTILIFKTTKNLNLK